MRSMVVVILVICGGVDLEQVPEYQEVVKNSSKRANGTRIVARHLYLPSTPEEPEFILPEVIDNRMRTGVFRPLSVPSIILPSFDLRAPLVNEGYQYRSPVAKQTSGINSQTQRDEAEIPGNIKINSISCQNSDDDVFFRANIFPPRRSGMPVIEGAGSNSCKLIKFDEEYRLELTKELFWNCGVHECSTETGRYYCLTIRFPFVPGLKLREDIKILLKCKIQEKITSHTKRINVKTLDTSARMAPRVATGGNKNAFETEIGLYRKTLGSENSFDAKIQPGGTVILGEEILLRVAVREGDGWRYSRISDVTVHYVESKRRKKIMNNMWILDSNGCLNPDIYEVASREQYRINPLESYLIFQAFMFDNMQDTDEMIMNVKVTGCLDGSDCALNCPTGHVRKARSLENSSNHTINWLDDISFRVVLLEEHKKGSTNTRMIIPYIFTGFILLAVITLFCVIKLTFKKRNSKF